MRWSDLFGLAFLALMPKQLKELILAQFALLQLVIAGL